MRAESNHRGRPRPGTAKLGHNLSQRRRRYCPLLGRLRVGSAAVVTLLLTILSLCGTGESLRGAKANRRPASPTGPSRKRRSRNARDSDKNPTVEGVAIDVRMEGGQEGVEAGITVVDHEKEKPIDPVVADRRNLTEHAAIMEKSHIDLTDLTLVENYGLDLGTDDPRFAARQVLDRITPNLEKRIAKVFENAKTKECRQKVARHFSLFMNALGGETELPFLSKQFESSCFIYDDFLTAANPENKSMEELEAEEEEKLWHYQPPEDEAEYIGDPSDLNILFGILAHSDPKAVIRLVETLYEPGHSFIIHVDGKAEKVYSQLVEFASSLDYVHVLPDQFRVRVNWGGFSMVNATLQVLKYAFALDQPEAMPLDFHKFVHMAESTYPIRSNAQIRRQLAEYPIDANLMHIVKTPTTPHEDSWHYFVECDDALHRIYRLPPKRWSNSGLDLMTSSQWFILSREFAQYLAEALPGTLVHEFIEYAQHMVVADEQFFGTILRHTEFCRKHQNSNFLFLQFGKWEDRLHNDTKVRDQRKCLMPNPDQCGRSPASLTMDKIPALSSKRYKPLFARKFDDKVDPLVKDAIEAILRNESNTFDTSFEGHGIMIVAKETIPDDVPLCLGIGNGTSPKVYLMPCFHSWVPKILDTKWEHGAVVVNETPPENRWDLGPCTFDGGFEYMENGEIRFTPGVFSPVGPVCKLKPHLQGNSSACLDSANDNHERVRSNLHVKDCNFEWAQLFSFGDGTVAPQGSLRVVSPEDLALIMDSTTRNEEALHLCLGVLGGDDMDDEHQGNGNGNTGKMAELHIKSDTDGTVVLQDSDRATARAKRHLEASKDSSGHEKIVETNLDDSSWPPLRHFMGKPLVTIHCANKRSVVEWLVVPYIHEAGDNARNTLIFESGGGKDGDEAL